MVSLLMLFINSIVCALCTSPQTTRNLLSTQTSVYVIFNHAGPTAIDVGANWDVLQLKNAIKQQFDIANHSEIDIIIGGETITSTGNIADVGFHSEMTIYVNKANPILSLPNMFDIEDQQNILGFDQNQMREMLTRHHDEPCTITHFLKIKGIIPYFAADVSPGDGFKITTLLITDKELHSNIRWKFVPETVKHVHIVRLNLINQPTLSFDGFASTTVEELSITNVPGLHQLDLSGITGSKSLRIITIMGNLQLKTLDVSSLSRIPSLTEIRICWNPIQTLINFESLSKLPNLQKLNLLYTNLAAPPNASAFIEGVVNYAGKFSVNISHQLCFS